MFNAPRKITYRHCEQYYVGDKEMSLTNHSFILFGIVSYSSQLSGFTDCRIIYCIYFGRTCHISSQ